MGFSNIAVNQLVNHIDKLEIMSDGEWKPNIIVRVGKGSDKPLDPNINTTVQIIQNHLKNNDNATIVKLDSVEKIKPVYINSIKNGGLHILVEYPELYYD